MAKIHITYGTLTGNTQIVAEHMAEYLTSKGHDVSVFEFFETTHEVMKSCDLLIVGESTWSDTDHNPIGEDFVAELNANPPDLTGVKAAYYGLGETHYDNYCFAIIKLEEQLSSYGAKTIGEIHKIDGFPDDDILEAASMWLDDILKELDRPSV